MRLQDVRMLEYLAAKAKEANVPGKLDQVADFLTTFATGIHELSSTLRLYIGPKTVGVTATAEPTDAELNEWELKLSSIRRDATMVSIAPGLIAMAPLLIQFAEFGLQLIAELRKRKQEPAPIAVPAS